MDRLQFVRVHIMPDALVWLEFLKKSLFVPSIPAKWNPRRQAVCTMTAMAVPLAQKTAATAISPAMQISALLLTAIKKYSIFFLMLYFHNVYEIDYNQASRAKRESSSRAITYIGGNRRNGLPDFESIAHAAVILTTRHTVVEDVKAVYQGARNCNQLHKRRACILHF